MNQVCREAIALKHSHENMADYAHFRDQCSEVLATEYHQYIARTRADMLNCSRQSKQWWKLNSILLHRHAKSSSVSALRSEGEWFLNPADKANLFAVTWEMKNTLPPPHGDHAHSMTHPGAELQHFALRFRSAMKHLTQLDVSKSTGPDDLPARVIKEVANSICEPMLQLCKRMLREGHWPKLWRFHNLIPLHKRKSVSDPNNYRGIHLTCVLSKVAERIIGEPLLNHFSKHECSGLHQWAYKQHRSSKDLVTLLTCSWLFSICSGKCIGAYLSDIAGAFDRVFKPYLMEKLRAVGVGETYLHFLSSFLDRRFGHVCVQGQKSEQIWFENQVFQGTVLGPPLWNIFFADIISAMSRPKSGKAFADDLNVFHEFDRRAAEIDIMEELASCRDRVHHWGYQNRVEFDGTKEHFVIVHPTRGVGNAFKLLGLVYDCKLKMDEAVDAIIQRARPKCKSLLRTKPFYNTVDMILQFKTHILGILESNIGGIYHATSTVLGPLGRIATRFVHELNLEVDFAFFAL